MRRSLPYLLPACLFAGLLWLFAGGLQRDPSTIESPLIGRPAPSFDLPSLKDPAVRVSDAALRGQVSVVNVWATWCTGCRQEHSTLLAIAAQNEVPIIGLNWKDDTELARRWLAELGDPYRITAVDADGRVAIDWGVYGAPETYLVGADGTILHKHIAPLTGAIWEQDFLPRIRAARESS